MKFSTIDEVIKRANDTDYGLAAGVFTKNIDTANLVSQGLQAGTVFVNNYLNMASQIPFGGYKMSGIGRENSEEGILVYTELKSVIVKVPQKNS